MSYASEDRERVRPIVEGLVEHGWSVWWDRRIPPGMTWPEMLEQALADTKAMVVVWTEASVSSKWVKIETSEGEDSSALVPVSLDRVKPPLQFRLIQSADLVDWDGSASHPQFRAVVDQLEKTLGPPSRLKQEAEAAAETKRQHEAEAAAEVRQPLRAPSPARNQSRPLPRPWLKPASIAVLVVTAAVIAWQFRPSAPIAEPMIDEFRASATSITEVNRSH